MPMTGREIIQEYTHAKHWKESYGKRFGGWSTWMSVRPEFYSGRGARLADLDSTILEMIYQGVKKEFGDAAAKNFCFMVFHHQCLSATAFLNSFYSFIADDCRFRGQASVPQNVDVGTNEETKEFFGMCSLAEMMCGSQRDETDSIRGPFLSWHAEELGLNLTPIDPSESRSIQFFQFSERES